MKAQMKTIKGKEIAMKTKRWMSLLLALLMVLGIGATAMAAEENPVGVVSGNAYYNESLGIYMMLPGNWRFLSDAELAERMNYDAQFASREGLTTLLEQNSSVCAMYATSSDDVSWNANLMVQDLGVYRFLDERSYFDLAKDGLTGLLEPQGFTNIQLTQTTFHLAGQEHVGAVMTGNMGLIQMYMIIVLVKGDRYMGSLTVASLTKEKTEEVLNFFVPLTDATKKAFADTSTTSSSSATSSSTASSQTSSGANDAQAQYAKAKAAFENKQYYTAYKLFTALGKYEDAASLASKCKRPTPDSGELSRNSDYKRKTCRLNVKNALKGGYNIYLRFYDASGDTFVCSAFIRSGKGIVVYLPEDTYLLKAAYGKGTWFGENEMFGDDAIYKELFTASLTNVGRYRTWICTIDDELAYTTIDREDF